MTNHMNASKLTRLAAILAASVALMATANIANAKGDHHHDNNGAGQFTNARQSMNGMEKKSEHRDKKKDKYAEKKKKKGCENIIVPTPECGVSSKDPVGSTRPGGTTAGTANSPTGGTTNPNGYPKGTVTISNGVLTSYLPSGPKGVTITSANANSITISNGTSSVTLPGGSLVLSGPGISVDSSSGVQFVRHLNGDVAIVTNANAAPPAGGYGPQKPVDYGTVTGGPGTVTTGDLKTAGKVVVAAGVAPAIAPAVTGVAGSEIGVIGVAGLLTYGNLDTGKFLAGELYKGASDFIGGFF